MSITIGPVVTSGTITAGDPPTIAYTYTATDGTGTFTESLHVAPGDDGYFSVYATNDDLGFPDFLADFDSFDAANEYARESAMSITPADLAEFFPRPKEG